MKRASLSVGTAAVLLAACAPIPNYPEAYHTQVVETWIGQDVSKLWESWGPPVRQAVAANGVQYHIYQQRIGRPANAGVTTADMRVATSTDPNCVTYFAVDPKTQVIRLANWRGTSCALHPPRSFGTAERPVQPTGF